MDEEDAKGRALQFAENQEWSDWHSLMETDGLDFAVVTNYKANPEKFNELVEEALGWTQETIDQAVQKYGDISLKELLTNPKSTSAGSQGQTANSHKTRETLSWRTPSRCSESDKRCVSRTANTAQTYTSTTQKNTHPTRNIYKTDARPTLKNSGS